jgi:translation initiation factor IF-1
MEHPMPKEELIEFQGSVVDMLPDGRFRVRLDNGHEILAYTSGRMKRAHIRVMTGDRVTVEMTPYDLSKGRITFREKGAQPPGTGRRRGPPLRVR